MAEVSPVNMSGSLDSGPVDAPHAPLHEASDGALEVNGPRGRALAVILAGITLMFANTYATQPILPALSAEFNVPPAASALTISVVVFGMGAASMIYGPLSDRAGRKPVILMAACLLVLPTVGAVFAPTFPVLVLCRALQGLLIPGITAVGLVYLQDVMPPSWRGVSTSAYVSATALGGLIGRLQGGFITDAFGWRISFGSFGVTTALSAVLLLFFLPESGQPVAGRASGPWLRELGQTYARLGKYLHERRVLGGALIACTMFFGFVSIFTFLPYRMERPPFSLSQGRISLLYLVYLVGSAVTPWMGWFSDRLGRRLVIGISLLLMLVGSLSTALNTLPSVVLGLAVLNAGLCGAHGVASAFVSDQVPASSRGSASSFYLAFYYLGGTVGPIVCGLAWQTLGWPGVLVACILTIGIALTSLLTLCA